VQLGRRPDGPPVRLGREAGWHAASAAVLGAGPMEGEDVVMEDEDVGRLQRPVAPADVLSWADSLRREASAAGEYVVEHMHIISSGRSTKSRSQDFVVWHDVESQTPVVLCRCCCRCCCRSW
jgi:hypothetical protein